MVKDALTPTEASSNRINTTWSLDINSIYTYLYVLSSEWYHRVQTIYLLCDDGWYITPKGRRYPVEGGGVELFLAKCQIALNRASQVSWYLVIY